jgi:aryl-alcohol dehydrogenase-like predicted oxidoreductase
MKFTKFGRTGLTVSRLCLGTGTSGAQADDAMAYQILDKAADAGVNFVDTADIYPMGPDRSVVGRAEQIVGKWVGSKRDQFIIATKAGGPMGPAPWQQGGSRKHLLDAINGSLKRLGTDYVDLYQLHFDDPETPLDETLEALDAIVRAGKARYTVYRTFLPTASRALPDVPSLCTSLAWPPCRTATACFSDKSSRSFFRWRTKRASR